MSNRLNQPHTVRAARRAGRRAAPPSRHPVATLPSARPGPSVTPAARRVRRVTVVFALLAVGLLVQAARLQLMEHQRFRRIAERQATFEKKISAQRGAIRDRHGSALAISVDVDSVTFGWRVGQRRATPKEIQDVARLLDRPVAEVTRKLSSERPFAYLARRVDGATARAVRALEVPGVRTEPEPKRFYANVQLAAHVLGFTNIDGQGRAGIERRYDAHLKGRQGIVTGQRDAFGMRIFSEGGVQQVALRGSDVELTLDRRIQYAAEQALEEAVEAHQAKHGVALVMAPDTGDVLAMASYPSFNPNNLRDTKVAERLNRAVNAVFEPGSTLKVVTVAAALEEGLVHPRMAFNCENGRWRIGQNEIHDADHRYGRLTVTEVVQKSSNICAAKIGFLLGKARLHRWLSAFGFGHRTGIALPGELKGLIRPAKRWSDIGLASISFGQGISATPLQMLQSVALVANDGVRAPPRLVRALVDSHGRRTEVPRAEAERVISASTAKKVTAMMVGVTEPGGTAPGAAIPGFRVAGKTGTAQKIDPVTRAYSHELFVSSFVGFVPADDPKLAVLVLIDEPTGKFYGGDVAAPAWRKVAVAALSTLDLRPADPTAWRAFLARYVSPPLPPPTDEAEAVNGQAARWAEEPASAAPASDTPDPAALDLALSEKAQRLLGLIQSQAPAQDGRHRMPNFARLTLHEVLNRAADTRCDLVVDGTGQVVDQRPLPGEALAPDARCELTLAPRR